MNENKVNNSIPFPRKIIHFLADPKITCHVVFVTKKTINDETSIKLQYMDLEQSAIEVNAANCTKFLHIRENWECSNYGEDRDEKLTEKYNIEDMKNIPNKGAYINNSTDQVPSLDREVVTNLKSIQFRFQTAKETVIFFKKFTSGKVLSHKKKLWTAVSGVLRLSNDNIIEIPVDYDCCKYQNTMLIFNPNNFEDLFEYHEIHAKIHHEVFKHLEDETDYKIENIESIKEKTLSQPYKLRTMPAIREKGIYKWSFAEIKKFLDDRPTTTVNIDSKKNIIKFKDITAMLNFYNDAHLDSKATDRSYLAQAKIRER